MKNETGRVSIKEFAGLTLPTQCISESYVKMKINLIVLFSHFFVVPQKYLWRPLKVFIKPFEAPQRSVKIKIYVNFFSSSRIGAGRVKAKYVFVLVDDSSEHKKAMIVYKHIARLKHSEYKNVLWNVWGLRWIESKVNIIK